MKPRAFPRRTSSLTAPLSCWYPGTEDASSMYGSPLSAVYVETINGEPALSSADKVVQWRRDSSKATAA